MENIFFNRFNHFRLLQSSNLPFQCPPNSQLWGSKKLQKIFPTFPPNWLGVLRQFKQEGSLMNLKMFLFLNSPPPLIWAFLNIYILFSLVPISLLIYQAETSQSSIMLATSPEKWKQFQNLTIVHKATIKNELNNPLIYLILSSLTVLELILELLIT